MPDKKITELVDGVAPLAADEFVVARTGDNFKLDWDALKGAAQADAVLDGDAAGGDLTGTYPNPTLAAVGAAAGPVGDGTHVAAVTIDTKGRVTGLTSVAITGAPPSGAAGGDLAGTYPNPTLAVIGAATGPVGDATHVAAVTVDAKGRVTTLTPVAITGTPPGGAAGGVLDGTYPSPGLAAAVAGAGLAETADVLSVNVDGATIEIATDTLGVKAGGIGTTQLADAGAGAAGPIGDATHVAAVTVDAKGRVTALSSVAITGTVPGGAAGGVLSGTYPNPGFAVDMATQAELDAAIATTVLKSLYDANTVLAADTDNTPAAVTMAASTILARLASGNIKAASVAEILTLLDVPTNAQAVLKTLYDANTVLKADADNTPAPLTMGASTILARLAAGNIVAATPSELRTLLALVIGTNVQAWDADLDAIAALADPNADRILFWDDSAGAYAYLAPGTNLTITGTTIDATSGPSDGWVSASETWTYSSVDGVTGVFTVAADVTTKYSPGMRVKFTQTTVKYGIITAVSTFSGGNTTITIYTGTDYTLANAAISANYFSTAKAPQGFPLDPIKWTITLINDTSDRAQGTITTGTWYNPGSLAGDIHIGAWNVTYAVINDAVRAATAVAQVFTSLSTANNSESDNAFTSHEWIPQYTGGGNRFIRTMQRSKYLTVAAKTQYFLVTKMTGTGTLTSIDFRGDIVPTLVKAVCAYL